MKRLGLAVLALALVVVGVARLGGLDRTAGELQPDSPTKGRASEPEEDLVREARPTFRSSADEPARDTAPEEGARAEEADDDAPGIRLELSFVQPDGSKVVVDGAEVILSGAHTYRATCAKADGLVLEGIAPGPYTLHAEASGFASPDLTLELDHDDNADVFLWPTGWIAVLLRTPEGLPFEELARELELDPEALFVDAFEVVSALEPSDAAWTTASATYPALFRKPPGYKSWNLPGSCIGSLMPWRPPPFWAGLKVLGVPLGWEFIPDGADHVTFTLDGDALAAHLATLTLRVVDSESRDPLPDASVTLLADTSAYRRRDHHDVRPTPAGLVTFERIVPDRYELSITLGEAFHQERITLAAGERRDLGEIALGAGNAVVLRVVDREGRPVHAWIEVGPYELGARADDLYPSMISRSTDANGEHHLASPSGLTIVRARPVVSHGHGTQPVLEGGWSAHTLLDPARLAPGPLVVVVHERVETTVDVQGVEAGALEVLDELELVVEARSFGPDAPLEDLQLVPGRYRVRLRGESGDVVAEKALDVGTTPGGLTLP